MTWRTARKYSKAGGLFAATSSAAPASASVAARPSSSLPPTGGSSSRPPSTAPRPTIPASLSPLPAGRPQPPGTGAPRLPPPPGTFPSPPGLNFDPGPRSTPGFHPRNPGPVFHPPGPGIGFRPGPAPALGRPGDLPGDHGAWQNESCFSQGSKAWKPDILTLTAAHSCPGEKGPQSPSRPPNISGGPGGYNSQLFGDESDVARALQYLGYLSPDGNAMIRRFQRHWNLVISRIALVPDRYRSISFPHVPEGNLQVDGDIGPNTLNALEIAMVNQRMSPKLAWPCVIEMVTTAGNGYGKQHLYNAAEGM